jgi:predicted deacetylase
MVKKDKKLNSVVKTNRKLVTLLIFLLIIELFMIFLVIRFFSERQLDDVSPGIACEEELLLKSDVLMVIPLFEGRSIAENRSWCEYILSLNKTLGMHGINHEYREFFSLVDEDEIIAGINEFEKCFGFYPRIFEAPQLALNGNNREVLKEMGFEVREYRYSTFHKVYHCSDTGLLSNRFIEIM